MAAFVYWTGIYNIVLACTFFFPALVRMLGIDLPTSVVWTEVLAWIVIFLGVMLILCSRDLKARASIVYWEGWLRIIVAVELAWFGFFRSQGALLGAIGLVDAAIGIVYIVGLPRFTGASHGDLALDRL